MQRPTPAQEAITLAFSPPTLVLRRADILARTSQGALDRAVRGGSIVRAAPDLYVLHSNRNEIRTRVAVACAWGGEAVTVGGVAALEHARPTGRAVDEILLLVPPSFKRACPPGIRLLRTTARFRRFDMPDARIAFPEDAAVQEWCRARPADREGAMLDLWRERDTYAPDVLRSAQAWPRVPDRARLVRLAALFAEGVKSYLEHRARTRVFTGAEWSHFERQVVLRPAGRKFEIDMLSRSAMLAVELDSRKHHAGDAQRRADIERDALLTTLGFTTLRLTFEDITRRPEWCRQTVRAAVDARRRWLESPRPDRSA